MPLNTLALNFPHEEAKVGREQPPKGNLLFLSASCALQSSQQQQPVPILQMGRLRLTEGEEFVQQPSGV